MECCFATDWTINESTLRETLQSDFIQHKFIETALPNTEFSLRIYPNGNDSHGNGVFFYLMVKKGQKVEVKYTVSIPTAKIVKSIEANDSCNFGGFICSRAIFFDKKFKFICDGKFTLQLRGTLKYAFRKRRNPFGDPIFGGGAIISPPNFTFIVEGKEIKVHKFILKQCSAIFTILFKIKSEGGQKRNQCKIEDFSYYIVKKAIDYCYTSSINDFCDKGAVALMKFANAYQLPNLKAEIEQQLCEKFSPENAYFFANSAADLQANNLQVYCYEFLITCIKESIAVKDSDKIKNNIKMELIDKAFCISLKFIA